MPVVLTEIEMGQAWTRIRRWGEFILSGNDMKPEMRFRSAVVLPVLLSALLLPLLVTAVSCKKEDKEKFKPSRLAGNLYSGASLETVQRKLDLMDGSFDILVDRSPLPSDTRPPYRLLVISKKHASLYGQSGELVLTLFNDRLMTVQFYTKHLAAARKAVAAEQKISLAGGETHIQPSTRVWVGKDENRRSYIGWIDKKLQAEQDAWLNQYDR
jgi:hypothetical protein